MEYKMQLYYLCHEVEGRLCFCPCLFVRLSTRYHQNLWMDFDETLWEDRLWANIEMINFVSGSRLRI